MPKPYLVLLRCGAGSTQLAQLEKLADAGFDIALSWSGADAPRLPGAVFVHLAEGPRWPALAAALAAHAERLDGYSHFWLPDDDVVFDAATVERLFAIADQLGLELAQPAYAAGAAGPLQPLLQQHAGFQLRFTNHVDPGAALVSRSMLAKLLPTWADEGLAPDAVWPRLSRLGRVAIIDATPVACGERSQAATEDALLNLGGLLDSGDAWCLGPQPEGLEVLLQALGRACAALALDARTTTRYLGRHLALADSAAAATIQIDLERALVASGLRFNCAPPPPPWTAAAAPDSELAHCQADLQDLQLRHQALVDERSALHDRLQGLLDKLGSLVQPASAASRPATRLIEAV